MKSADLLLHKEVRYPGIKKNIINFYLDQLNFDKVNKYPLGVITLQDIHSSWTHLDYALGLAHPERRSTLPGAKFFRIYTRPTKDIFDLLMTLAHECVHVKQFASKELQIKTYRGERGFFWMNKEFYSVYPTTDPRYWKYPWEIEAFSQEKFLAKMFIEKYPRSYHYLENY